jgi:hypothetical protein
LNVPATVGVPLIVIVFEAQTAVTPAGRPVGMPMPVATTVACVTGERGVCTHTVGVAEAAKAALSGVTSIVPVANTVPQPPVSGML